MDRNQFFVTILKGSNNLPLCLPGYQPGELPIKTTRRWIYLFCFSLEEARSVFLVNFMGSCSGEGAGSFFSRLAKAPTMTTNRNKPNNIYKIQHKFLSGTD
jgi:hypothetical protein